MRDINNLSFITKIRREVLLLNMAVPDFSILDHEITFNLHEVLLFLREFDRIQTKLEIYEPFNDCQENINDYLG